MKKKIFCFFFSTSRLSGGAGSGFAGLLFFSSLLFAFPAFDLTPNDSLFPDQWYLQKIHAPSAWDITTGSNTIIVAVLDTGFDLNHPDLIDQLWVNKNEIAGDGIDNDGNGFVDDVNGFDFINKDGSPEPNVNESFDTGAVSHGTVIAGIIGAVSNNAKGIAGINWQVRLMDIRILDNKGVGNSTTAREGIEYAVKNGAKIINLSFTGFDNDPRLESAIKAANDAGVLVIAAVGNTEGVGLNVDEKPIYPACNGHGQATNGIIGVAATDDKDAKASFSNYGATCTDLSAPGVDILSTVYENEAWAPFKKVFYQKGWAGTSMAAPMVSGAAALLASRHPTLKPEQLKNILRLSADPVHESGPAQGKMGSGRLNIANALNIADLLFPPEVHSGSLIKLTCSPNVDVNDPCRAVYFYAGDGKRHAFPNDRVYFSWFKDFSTVKEVSASFMSSLALGKNVTYHPGTKLVKFQTVPTVFAVESKGTLRAIRSEEIAAGLYGADWNKKVDDISDVFFNNYQFGQPIQSVNDFNVIVAIASVNGLGDNF